MMESQPTPPFSKNILVSPTYIDAGLLLLRLWTGAMMIDHGKGKVFGDNSGLVNRVAEMGFPAPEFFAWAAGLSEFAGGILLILGLFTRPAALFVGVTMFVAGFIRHADDPFSTKEKALTYMAIALVLVLTGPGRYAIDAWFARRRRGEGAT